MALKKNVLKIFFCNLLISILLSSQPLKVLFVTNKFPYEPRPYIDNQIASFLDAGVKVNVLAFETSNHTDYEIAQKYNFKDITFYDELPININTFDIIYCQFPGQGLEILQWKKEGKIKGKVVTFFRAGCDFEKIIESNEKMITLFQKSDYIFVVCKAFKNRLIRLGCPENKIIVHHSAINVDHFPFKKRVLNKDHIKIITIGRLHPMKGNRYVIDAINQLHQMGYTITYNIYGEGREKDNILQLIKKYNLERNVFLKGFCNHNEIAKLLHEHDIFILGSCTTETGAQEGIPNVLMEAMATGMPVIATRHSGIPELIKNGKNGLLTPEYDSQALAEQLIQVISLEDHEAIGINARMHIIKAHNTKIQSKKILSFFKKMCLNSLPDQGNV